MEDALAKSIRAQFDGEDRLAFESANDLFKFLSRHNASAFGRVRHHCARGTTGRVDIHDAGEHRDLQFSIVLPHHGMLLPSRHNKFQEELRLDCEFHGLELSAANAATVPRQRQAEPKTCEACFVEKILEASPLREPRPFSALPAPYRTIPPGIPASPLKDRKMREPPLR